MSTFACNSFPLVSRTVNASQVWNLHLAKFPRSLWVNTYIWLQLRWFAPSAIDSEAEWPPFCLCTFDIEWWSRIRCNMRERGCCFTLIRWVTLCGGAFSLLHCLRSIATENPCSRLAQTGRNLLLAGGSLLSSTSFLSSPVLLGAAIHTGC